MKRILFIVILLALFLTACGGAKPDEGVDEMTAEPIPETKILAYVPKIGWGSMPGRGPTDYPLPGCLGTVLAFISSNGIPGAEAIDNANRELMNIMGISYAAIWAADGTQDKWAAIELTDINDHFVMIDRALRYFGRGYNCIEDTGGTEKSGEIKAAVIESVNLGNPVLAYNICGIPDYCVITGYENFGDRLVGWAYNEKFAEDFYPNGMFAAKFSLSGDPDHNSFAVIIGGPDGSSLSDGEIAAYAAETMERGEPQNKFLGGYLAGIPALERFKADLTENTDEMFAPENSELMRLFILNLAEPRAYITALTNIFREKYSESEEVLSILADMEDVSVSTHETCWRMWAIQNDAGMTAEQKRDGLAELMQVCIDGDIKLLESLKLLKNSI